MLLTISGPSTIGKDSTWLREAENIGFCRVVPFTSRPIRKGEVDGRDYWFLTVEEFQRRIAAAEFCEWDFVLGHYYGSPVMLFEDAASGKDLVMQVLARMAVRLKGRLSHVFTVLLSTSDSAILNERLEARGYFGAELILRNYHGQEELMHAPLFDVVVPDADIISHNDVLRVLTDITANRGN